MRKIYPYLQFWTVKVTHAQDYSFLPEAKLADHKASTWNVGAILTQKLLHLNGGGRVNFMELLTQKVHF